jgi:hypothetical protein
MRKLTLLLLVSILAVGLTLSGCNAVNDMFAKLFGKGQTPMAPGPAGPGGTVMPGGGGMTERILSGPAHPTLTSTRSVSHLEVLHHPWAPSISGSGGGPDGYTVLGDFDLDNGDHPAPAPSYHRFIHGWAGN